MSRPAAAERVRTMLAMVPYIVERGGASIAELSRAFGLSEAALRKDLDLLFMCGVPPYTPDALVFVDVEDDVVTVEFGDFFDRPLRLTPAEGFHLLAAGRALLEVPGADEGGALASALAKLEEALGAREIVEVDLPEPEHLARLRQAAADSERLQLRYYSFHRDTLTERTVDPYGVASLDGQWYVTAWCHTAGGERLFRVDRIEGIEATGERFERRPHPEPPETFDAAEFGTTVVLDLPPDARWVAESYPMEAVEERRGGRLRVTLSVSAQPWLERVLLRAGPEAKVVKPARWKSLPADAARRVLARYGDSGRMDGLARP